METRTELVQLLAKVLHRVILARAVPLKVLAPQNVPDTQQVCLASSPKTLLSVTTAVNSNLSGENK